ncbi:Wadjet anti-phage system protein JetD domain-containing protein [Pseudomonas aeruginosa]
MDRDTLIAHVERGVCEDRPAELPDYGLTLAERSLFEELRSATHGVGRLEQERLSQDYVEQQLAAWTYASAGL